MAERIACRKCGRSQSVVPGNVTGGITELEAQTLGWARDELGWLCPFCTGNDAKLRKVFERRQG
jgi:hypothetical protein